MRTKSRKCNAYYTNTNKRIKYNNKFIKYYILCKEMKDLKV